MSDLVDADLDKKQFKKWQDVLDYWESIRSEGMQRVVVCAANQHKDIPELLVCGARHFDSVMRLAIKASKYSHHDFHEQGFIDNFGIYMNREEAAKVAFKAGQIGEKTNILFSEDLY